MRAAYRRIAIASMVDGRPTLWADKEQSMATGFKEVPSAPWSFTTKLTVGIGIALAAVLVVVLYV